MFADEDLRLLIEQGKDITKIKTKRNKRTGKEARYYYTGSDDNLTLVGTSLFKPHKEKDRGMNNGERKLIVFADGCSKIKEILDSDNFDHRAGSEFYNVSINAENCDFFSRKDVQKAIKGTQGFHHKRGSRCSKAGGIFNSGRSKCYCAKKDDWGENYLQENYRFMSRKCNGERITHDDNYAEFQKLANQAGFDNTNYPEIREQVFTRAAELCAKHDKKNQFKISDQNNQKTKSQGPKSGSAE